MPFDWFQDDADAVDNDTMKQRNDEEEEGEGRPDTGEVRGHAVCFCVADVMAGFTVVSELQAHILVPLLCNVLDVS